MKISLSTRFVVVACLRSPLWLIVRTDRRSGRDRIAVYWTKPWRKHNMPTRDCSGRTYTFLTTFSRCTTLRQLGQKIEYFSRDRRWTLVKKMKLILYWLANEALR